MVSKKQHYLPQFYLKHWANENDLVWVYFKNKEPFLFNVKNIGAENYLYSIEKNDFLEQWLAQIDGDLSTVFYEVQDQISLDEKTIIKLKAFLIILMSRNPKTKDISGKIMEFDAKGTPKKNPFAQVLRFRTKVIASEIEPLSIQIIQIPDHVNFSFVTSNQPFFIVGKLEKQFAESMGLNGLVQRKSIQRCWMPLTPKILVFFTSNKIRDQVIKADITEKYLININKNLTLGADRNLISNSDSLFKNQPELREIFYKDIE